MADSKFPLTLFCNNKHVKFQRSQCWHLIESGFCCGWIWFPRWLDGHVHDKDYRRWIFVAKVTPGSRSRSWHLRCAPHTDTHKNLHKIHKHSNTQTCTQLLTQKRPRQGQGLEADTLDARRIPCGSATMLHLAVSHLAWELLVSSQHESMCRILPWASNIYFCCKIYPSWICNNSRSCVFVFVHLPILKVIAARRHNGGCDPGIPNVFVFVFMFVLFVFAFVFVFACLHIFPC